MACFVIQGVCRFAADYEEEYGYINSENKTSGSSCLHLSVHGNGIFSDRLCIGGGVSLKTS